MLKNYFVIALRNIFKNKLFATINIVGLAIGLAIFILSQVVARYELSHDSFFPNSDRIFAIYSYAQPEFQTMPGAVAMAFHRVVPLLSSEVPEAVSAARLIGREYLAGTGDRNFYQSIRFVDPEFLEIFKLDFIAGNPESALAEPSNLIVTESAARKYFGDADPLGKVITFRNQHDLKVSAVVRDLPANSHLTSSLVDQSRFELIATVDALSVMAGFDVEGDWETMSSSDLSYALLSAPDRVALANEQLDRLYEKHLPDEQKRDIAGWQLRPISDVNTWLWDATGFPVIASIRLLGFLILLIACLNYVNLATAQLMHRTREVGLRKTMGASRVQLFSQFISESVFLTAAALVLAIIAIGQVLPLINDLSGKAISFDLVSSPELGGVLIVLILLVGLLAGGYPAWLVSSGRIVGMLNGEFNRGRKGSLLRNVMLIAQFTISVFLMIAVAIVYAQNQKVAQGGAIFAKDQILVLSRIDRPEIRAVLDPLRNELLRTPGVKGFALSSQVPFQQSHSEQAFSRQPGDQSGEARLYNIQIDDQFTAVYDMPVVAGRELTRDISSDRLRTAQEGSPQQPRLNVLVNESAARRLGFQQPADAIDQYFFSLDPEETLQYQIVGVVADNNFLGFFNGIKPIVFYRQDSYLRLASIRIEGGAIPQTVERVEDVWERLVPDYPIQQRFLSDYFDDIFGIFAGINAALSGFAVLALLVALIGLFGLTAFIAEQRTKEVGIRKVMGASVPKIVRLLVWQFLRPVFIAIVLAAPLAWLAAQAYINFFADRIGLSPLVFLSAGFLAVLVAALTTSVHAIKAARARPVLALRYE